MNLNRSNTRFGAAAFTLVELLVVIAIMGIVAAMIIGGAGMAKQKAMKSRVTTEMQVLVTAIDHYQSTIGFYPPDHKDTSSTDPATRILAEATPPLFYELHGATGGAPDYSVIG